MAGEHPTKDEPSVDSDGNPARQLICGVAIRYARTLEDKRGEVTEVYRPEWDLLDAPLTSVHQVSVRPGAIKGWSVHLNSDDRLFVSLGYVRLALFDGRKDSRTHTMLNVLTISERSRALIVVPRGVFHAVQNIGQSEALLISLPTVPYDYKDPDKYRLPVKNSIIPFAFDDPNGW